MKVVIIEDEYPNALKLQALLSGIDPSIEVLSIIDSVEKSCQFIDARSDIDLIFLDIMLTDGHGIEILEKTKRQIPVIFTTAYDQYALEAFKYLSIDYLLKPIKAQELKSSIDKFKENFRGNSTIHPPDLSLPDLFKSDIYPKLYLCKIGRNHYPVKTEQIAYFFFEERETWVMSKSGKEYILSKTLDQLAGELNPRLFFRANRKTICSRDAIEKYKTLEKSKLQLSLLPKPPFEVVVSSEKSRAFKIWILDS